MNERIQELEKQSYTEAMHEMGGTYKAFDKEKFAELIVAECAHVAVFKDSGTVATADVAGHMAAGRSIAARLIREHFGVE
jgi:hypothetical protein